MKLAVLTCAAFPSEEEARAKLWIFLRSCEKFKIDPILYGMGTPQFPGYKKMMLDMQLEALKAIDKSFTHVLFTDGWDAFFVTDLKEIIEKYTRMGKPTFLASAYIGLGNESDMSKYQGCFDMNITYRYPNRGGYIAELQMAIGCFQAMVNMPHQTGDDCFNWYEGWREGWFRPALDSECQIFQVSNENAILIEKGPNLLDPNDRSVRSRVFNTKTGSQPCILHLSGGYTDQQTGKDAAMKPWAKAMDIIG